MASHQQHGGYDDGYGQQGRQPAPQQHGNDAYYQDGYDDQYYDNQHPQQQGGHGGQGYYDDQYVLPGLVDE